MQLKKLIINIDTNTVTINTEYLINVCLSYNISFSILIIMDNFNSVYLNLNQNFMQK